MSETLKTYTDAPSDYDGFGTRTLAVVGTHKASTDRPVRLVETPAEHVQWQRTRYQSGGHLAAIEAEWARLSKAPWFVLKEAAGRHSTDIAYHHEPEGWLITKADAGGEQDIILARLDVPSSDDPTLTDDEQKANGTLWAAAPALLAALKGLLAACSRLDEGGGERVRAAAEVAEAAVARAEGTP